MQTVNFRCGHCNNLMAVGTEFLGQQVRCPHCQNVVVAPPAAPAPAPAANYSPGMESFPPSESAPLVETISAPTASWMSSSPDNGQAAATEPLAEPKKPREPRPVKINWFIPLVFVPLLLYAVLATA